MELRTLRYFTAVAEELSFTRAASRLHMSQPPLSQQIKALEQELGVKLLSRTPHKVELTEAGALFLKDALHLLALADNAKQRVQNFSSEVIGHLSVGFLGSLTYDFLPQVLRLIRGRYPQITLSMQEMGKAFAVAGAHARKNTDCLYRSTRSQWFGFTRQSLRFAG